jgi:hypothetical protein
MGNKRTHSDQWGRNPSVGRYWTFCGMMLPKTSDDSAWIAEHGEETCKTCRRNREKQARGR